MQKTITSVVKDEAGNLLPVATIVVKGANVKAITGDNGKFALNKPNNATILIVSYVCMDHYKFL
jgi:hypothetical protein